MIILIDGDVLAQIACHSNQEVHHTYEDLYLGRLTETEIKKILKEGYDSTKLQKFIFVKPLGFINDEAITHVCNSINLRITLITNAVANMFKIDQEDITCEFYLTYPDKSNFRYSIATIGEGYKANRKNLRKPKLLTHAWEYVRDIHKGVVVHNREADDEIADMFRHHQKLVGKDNVVIASIDKDFLQLEGWHIDSKKLAFKQQSATDAIQHLYYQIIEGDIADNIPGLKYFFPPRSCGETTTRKRVAKWTTHKELYQLCKTLWLDYSDLGPVKFEEVFKEMYKLVKLGGV